MPDFTSLATLNADGWLIEAPTREAQSTNLAGYDFGPGKFTPAIRANGSMSPSRFVYAPSDGVVPGKEGTIEWWSMHDTLNMNAITSKTVAEVRTQKLVLPVAFGGAGAGIIGNALIWKNAAAPARISKNFAVATSLLNYALGTWVSFAIVYWASGLVQLIINGGVVSSFTGFPVPDHVTDAGGNEGLRFGGTDGGAGGIWTSDVRVSATPRVVGQTPTLKSLTGSVSFDVDADVLKPVPDDFFGTLHGAPADVPSTDVAPVSRYLRTDKALTACPSKAGAPDATHPTIGQSGLCSYDWGPLDRSLLKAKEQGMKVALSVDGCPQILGGNVAPYSGAQLTDWLIFESNYGNVRPNDMTAWAHIVRDLIYHIKNEIAGFDLADIVAWSVWNEPEGGFWPGTDDNDKRTSFIPFYRVTANAIRDIDATKPIIGAELLGVAGKELWIDDLVAERAAATSPVDGMTIHDYTGDLSYIEESELILGQREVAGSLPAGTIPLSLGEMNWNLRRLWNTPTPSADPLDDLYWIRALGAAYTTAYVCNALMRTNLQRIAYSHITARDGYGSTLHPGGSLVFGHGADGDPRSGSFAPMQLVGPNGEHWANWTAAKGIQMVLGPNGSEILDGGADDLPPGVYRLIVLHPDGSVGIMLANYGWANQASRDVDITIDGLTGDQRVRRYLVYETNSRWDQFEDDPAGAALDDLELMSNTVEDPTGGLDLSVTVPKWGSVFLTIEPDGGGSPPSGTISQLVNVNGQPVLLPTP